MSTRLFALSRVPSVADFIALRSLAGWGSITEAQAALSIKNSLAFVTVYHQEQLLAMGRVVGDGALFFYLQDIVVHPDHQQKGLGSAVMKELHNYLQDTAQSGSTIALLSAKGKEGFYTRFGYRRRDGQALGWGMCRFV